MQSENSEKPSNNGKRFAHAKGVTYFDKDTERKMFFALTLVMLVLGVLAKMGLF